MYEPKQHQQELWGNHVILGVLVRSILLCCFIGLSCGCARGVLFPVRTVSEAEPHAKVSILFVNGYVPTWIDGRRVYDPHLLNKKGITYNMKPGEHLIKYQRCSSGEYKFGTEKFYAEPGNKCTFKLLYNSGPAGSWLLGPG